MLMMCVVFNFILGRLLLLPVTFNSDVHILRFSVQYSRFSFRFRVPVDTSESVGIQRLSFHSVSAIIAEFHKPNRLELPAS